MPQLRVLVADDSLAFRSVLVDSLQKLPAARIVALAGNRQEAIEKFDQFSSQVRVRIVGTDISEAAVNAANRGEFTSFDLQRGLSEGEVARYFVK